MEHKKQEQKKNREGKDWQEGDKKKGDEGRERAVGSSLSSVSRIIEEIREFSGHGSSKAKTKHFIQLAHK